MTAEAIVPSGYQQTEVGVIPADWSAAPIGSFASFQSGEGISVAALSVESSDAPFPVFGGNGIAGYTKRELVHDPVVVVGRVGQKCGETYLTSGPAWITDNALYPRFLSDDVDTRFLAYALKGSGLNDVKNRNDLPLVTQSILHSFSIPLPSTLAEQETIAEALRDADALIESLEHLVDKKRSLKQAAMQKLLTGKIRLPGFEGKWVQRPLAELADIRSGGTPSTTSPNFWDGNVLWCTPTDITGLNGSKYLSDTSRKITESGLKSSSAELVPAHSIVMTSRATIGECAINTVPVSTNQGFKNFVPFDDVDVEFLYYLLETQTQGFISLCAGSTFLEIRKAHLATYELRLPRVKSEQTAIAEILSDMDDEIDAVEAKLTKACQIKQGMMQELLTGRTRLV